MTPLLRKLLGMNWALVAAMLLLAVFGVVAIYSCTYMNPDPAYQRMWIKQSIWIGISVVAFFVASLVDYRWVRWGALPIYFVTLVALALTLVIGVEIGNAKSWLKMGPIQFQPAQMAILAGILILSLFLSHFRNFPPLLKLAACGAIAGAPALLILMQPDMGSTLVWGPVVFALLFIGRIPKRYLIVLTLLGLIAMPVAYHFKLKPYQKMRLICFIDPDIDPLGDGWAIKGSLVAIGSGGWGGKGFKAQDSQVERGVIPATTVPNDYIFVPIAEQGGFVMAVALIGAFGVLLGACLLTAFTSADDLGLLLATGITALLFTHIYQNIGMSIAIMPVTGVPLPLISYSGSFVAVVMFSLGLVNSVWVHRNEAG